MIDNEIAQCAHCPSFPVEDGSDAHAVGDDDMLGRRDGDASVLSWDDASDVKGMIFVWEEGFIYPLSGFDDVGRALVARCVGIFDVSSEGDDLAQSELDASELCYRHRCSI